MSSTAEYLNLGCRVPAPCPLTRAPGPRVVGAELEAFLSSRFLKLLKVIEASIAKCGGAGFSCGPEACYVDFLLANAIEVVRFCCGEARLAPLLTACPLIAAASQKILDLPAVLECNKERPAGAGVCACRRARMKRGAVASCRRASAHAPCLLPRRGSAVPYGWCGGPDADVMSAASVEARDEL